MYSSFWDEGLVISRDAPSSGEMLGPCRDSRGQGSRGLMHPSALVHRPAHMQALLWAPGNRGSGGQGPRPQVAFVLVKETGK